MTPAPASRTRLQADALVQEIQRQVAAQQRELLDTAAREAEQIRQRARVKARRQLRRAIQDMRSTEAQRTRQARAELETAMRRQAAARASTALASAWPRLRGELSRRWQDPSARAQWLAAQVAMGRARLPRKDWVVHHPAAWTEAETAALVGLLRSHGVADATLHADAGLTLGLVIEAAGVRLDSSPQGLLCDRARIESALLARLDPGASAP